MKEDNIKENTEDSNKKDDEDLPRYVETKNMTSYTSKNGTIVWRRQPNFKPW